MNDCLFCSIIAGKIPSAKVYEDEHVFAFRDIEPQAPVHVLIVPKKHVQNALALQGELSAIAGHVYAAAGKIAVSEGIAESGFRVITNCGKDGAQSVQHLHFHLLGGKQLSGKMD